MDENNNCSACNIKTDKDNYKKDRTNCNNCYNKKKTKNNNFFSEKDVKDLSTSDKEIKDNKASVSAYENHRHVNTGPSNVGKNYYMLKILKKIGNKRRIHITTRSPNQYPKVENKY